MKNKKITKVLLITLCGMALVGCEVRNNSSNNTPENNGTLPSSQDNTNSSGNYENNSSGSPDTFTNGSDLLDSATIDGHVVDFSGKGFTLSPAITENDGLVGVEAAEGYEDPETNVNVTYKEGCIFQIAKINISTGNLQIREASISDIKKQTSLSIFGDFQDEHNLTADKVIIIRYE